MACAGECSGDPEATNLGSFRFLPGLELVGQFGEEFVGILSVSARWCASVLIGVEVRGSEFY